MRSWNRKFVSEKFLQLINSHGSINIHSHQLTKKITGRRKWDEITVGFDSVFSKKLIMLPFQFPIDKSPPKFQFQVPTDRSAHSAPVVNLWRVRSFPFKLIAKMKKVSLYIFNLHPRPLCRWRGNCTMSSIKPWRNGNYLFICLFSIKFHPQR